MAGPSIKLSVAGSGKETIDGLNVSLDKLRANLQSLKISKPDLSGLEALTAEFKRFRGEFIELAQGQKTALAELSEVMKKGFAAAAGTVRSGGRAVTEEIKTTEQQQAQAFASLSRQMQKQAEDMSKASARVTNSLVKQAGKGEAGTQTLLYGKGAGAQAELAEMAAYYRGIEEAHKAGVAKLEAEYQKSIVQLEKSVDKTIAAARRPGYLPAGPAWWDQILKEEEAALLRLQKLDAAFQARGARSQLGTAVQARAQLDQGISPELVKQQYGGLATQAAQSAKSLNELKLAHDAATNSMAQGAPKVNGLTASLKDAHGAVRGLVSGFGQALPMFASIGTFLAGAALSNAFVQTVKLGSEVGHVLELIGTLGGNTAKEVQLVKNSLLELGAVGPQGPLEIAEGFKTLSLAGLNAQQQLSSIRDVLNLSVAGGVPVQQAAEGLVAIGTAFGYTAEGYGRVADIITKGAAISMASISDFTGAMRAASVVGTLYGVSLEDVATQIAQLSQIGIRASAAGTSLRNFYSELTADSGKAAKTIKSLGIEVLDSAGSVKSLIPLAMELNNALKDYDAASQRTILKNISNERGGKDLVAVLDAYRKAAAEGKTSELESFYKQITESYGAAAIAAANLSVTAKSQILSVVSALQTSLVATFDSVEPTIIVLSARMREAFSSEAFRETISNLATSVANFTKFLADHAGALKIAAEVWLVYKAAVIGFTAFSQVSLMLTSITAAVRGLTAAQVAGAAASAAAPAFGLAGVATAASAAAPWLVRILGLLGPIGLALSAGAALWLLFGNNSVDASVKSAQASTIATNQIIENLEKEAVSLERKNALILAGKTVAEASMLTDQQAVKEKLELQRQADRQVRESAVQREQSAYDKQVGLSGIRNTRGAAARPADASALNAARAELEKFDAETAALAARLDSAQQRVRDLNRTNAENLNKQLADQRAAAQAGTKTFSATDPGAGAQGEFSTLSSLHKQYVGEIKQYYDQQQKLLDKSHAGKLVSDIEYQIRSESLQKAAHDAEIQEIERFVRSSEGALARVNTRGDKAVKVGAERERVEVELREAQQLLQFKREAAQIDKLAAENKAALKLDTDLAKIKQGVDSEQARLDIETRYLTTLPEIRAAEEARVATEAKYAELLREKLVLLAQVEAALRNQVRTPGDVSRLDNGTGSLARYQAEIERLKAEIERITAASREQGQRSADIKRQAPEFLPQWKRQLAEWADTTRSFQRYWDEMVNGVVDKGRSIWEEFIKTGKLRFGSLVDFIRDQMSKVAYEQLIAPYITSLGKKIADKLLGKRPGGEPGGRPSEGAPEGAGKQETWEQVMSRKAGDVWSTIKSGATTLWDTLKTGASTVWDFVKGGAAPLMDLFKSFGSTVWTLIQNLISWGSSLISSGAGSSSGGLGGLLGGLFGGSGGGGGVNNAGGSGDFGLSLIENALGGVYGAVSAYAKGDVFSSPTFFRFAHGGGFGNGVMGEAGPEAVMPLKRGANGSLGVVNHGGSGGGMNVIINTPPGVVVERQEKRDDGKTLEMWLALAEKRAVAAVNKSIATGGSTAQVLRSKGVNTSGGLLRRD